MRRLPAQSIVSALTSTGMKSSSSQMIHEGRYAPTDADWNYKDIPHLNELHNQVDGFPTAIGDEIITTIFLQKFGPFRLPLTVVNYAIKSGQVYYTSFGPFTLVIDTTWEAIESERTRVTTTYNLCSSKFLRFTHPVVHQILRRNYEVLMAEDIPMREHRGNLRAHGFSFKNDPTGYSFLETLRIAEDNVVPSSDPHQVAEFEVNLEDLKEGRNIVQNSLVSGVVIVKETENLSVFERICRHEGAPLDKARIENGCLRCPWHGREVSPLVRVDLDAQTVSVVSNRATAALNSNCLRIQFH